MCFFNDSRQADQHVEKRWEWKINNFKFQLGNGPRVRQIKINLKW